MSLKDCIDTSHAAGEITLEEAQALKKRFDQLVRQIRSPQRARQQLTLELEAEAFNKKRRALLTEARRQQLDQDLLAHRNRTGNQDPADALLRLMEHHGEARLQDIEHKRLAILGGAHAKMEQLLHDQRKGAVRGDLRRRQGTAKAQLDNIVRELFGENTGDARASQLAGAWSDVAEDLRQRFNGAGGAIGKLEKWGMPQHHNQEALSRRGRKQWVEDVTPLLDRDKMLHPLTKERMGDDELKEALEHVWDAITTDGWMRREPSSQGFGKGALFRQHADSRFLVFRDADNWLRYQKDYGQSDPFASMMGHVSTMARDIAFMEVLGPNPGAMFTYLKQRVLKMAATVEPRGSIIDEKMAQLTSLTEGLLGETARKTEIVGRIGGIHRQLDKIRRKAPTAGPSRRQQASIDALRQELFTLEQELSSLVPGAGRTVRSAELQAEMSDVLDELSDLEHVPFPLDNAADHARRSIAAADSMWDVMRGQANAPVNSRWANGLAATRSLITSAALGSAAVSALSDVTFGAITRKFVGLPTRGILNDMTKQFGRNSRREAVRAGLIMDSSLHVLQSESRYAGSINSQTMAGFIADRVIGLSGLHAWTTAAKHSFGMAFQAELGDRVGLALADLPKALSDTLQRHGITAPEWDIIRRARLHQPQNGAVFLRPSEIAEAGGRPLAEKYQSMIIRETRFAVPEGTVTSRVTLGAGSNAGTLIGEISRSFSQFKSFAVSVMMLHGGRVAREVGAGRKASGAMYAGSLLLGTAGLGGLVLQLKEAKQGRDPRPMDDPAFWGAALLQGGGLGIYGDLLFGQVNRYGGGMSSTFAGPLIGRVNDLNNLTTGNIAEALQGKDTKFGAELARSVKQWTPGGNIWYAQLAYERLVMDQLQHLLDPKARQAFRRKMGNRKRDYGNEYFWRPGETKPKRAPNLSTAIGGRK